MHVPLLFLSLLLCNILAYSTLPVAIISQFATTELLSLQNEPISSTHKISATLDLHLGLHPSLITILPTGISVGANCDGPLCATWDELRTLLPKKKKKGKITEYEGACYNIYEDGTSPWRVSTQSANTNRVASLFSSSATAPTMVLAGFTMHRIVQSDPSLDTKQKIIAARPRGDVLDTCCGLGYTAIAASQTTGVNKVVTVEYDDASVEICKSNPWSAELFSSENIELVRGDVCEHIKTLPDSSFSTIIHDPPALALCKGSDLYGQNFYNDLKRVLTPNGRLFHYVGSPESRESGRLFGGIKLRLNEAGFGHVQNADAAFGITAVKQ